jgi:acyl-ACP thioesterase
LERDAVTELVQVPEGGRVFTQDAWAGLGDCAPSGRARLDAIARWLQDVAYADVEDAGLAQAAWVVRRARIEVRRFPQFAERMRLQTFCSGLGRAWAERRTSVLTAGTSEPIIEAVWLWVHLDPTDFSPAPFNEADLAVYGTAAGDRRIRARLQHPGPPPNAVDGRRLWTFRATDCDIADHVNNAAYWVPIEEELLTTGEEPTRINAEIEYRKPAQPGDVFLLRDGARRWIVDAAGDAHASVVLAF